mgnify:CR=1 FL=1
MGSLGARGNFSVLLGRALELSPGLRFFAFCDQDDVWLPEKLDRLVSRAVQLEQEQPGLPVLVHCDLRMVDEDLAELHPSFWRHQRIDPGCTDLRSLILKNTVTASAFCPCRMSSPREKHS